MPAPPSSPSTPTTSPASPPGPPAPIVEPSSSLGIDATAMEARIFADAAVARIKDHPFTLPATTGAARPTVCGVVRFPGDDRSRVTPTLRAWLDHFATGTSIANHPDPRWSRATAGWRDRLTAEADRA